MRTEIKLVTNEEQALRAIRTFREEGRSLNEIYVLAHDGERTEGLSKLTDTRTIGLMEEGVVTAFANLFRSRGDQIRAKMQSLGISEQEAERYEKELDKGKIMVLSWYDDTSMLDREAALKQAERERETSVPPMGVYPVCSSRPVRTGAITEGNGHPPCSGAMLAGPLAMR
ncbi:general stress protein [Paenibacillus sp. P26]|nr:general stress protein [Paenibacillus sp. P26]